MGTTSALMTVDEFLKLPDIEERRVELIQGEVVDMASGGPVHETVKSNLNGIVRDWLKDHPIGKLYVETGYQIENYSSLVPDLSVLSIERVKRGLQDLLRGHRGSVFGDGSASADQNRPVFEARQQARLGCLSGRAHA